MLSHLEGQVDLIVSNPPYISESDRSTIEFSVIAWEDEKALFSPNHGSAHQMRIIQVARTKFLRPLRSIMINSEKSLHHENEDMKNENERAMKNEEKIPRIVMELDGNQRQLDIVRNSALEFSFDATFHQDSAKKTRYVSLYSE